MRLNTLLYSCICDAISKRSKAALITAGFAAMVAVLSSLAPVRISGQAFVNGSISGTVTDSTGAVIAGANMTLTNIATSARLTASTDAAGFYQFPNLPPGNYRV